MSTINFDNGSLYSRVGKYQVGGASDYAETLNKASQSADETANDRVDNRQVGKDPRTGQYTYGAAGGAPLTSPLGLFGNWAYNLAHSKPIEETGFIQDDDSVPVQDGDGSSVDTVMAPEEMPPVPEVSTTGGTA